MESKGIQSPFLYELPSPRTPPRISTRNIPKHDKHLKKLMEWPHDHQPSSSFYESPDSNTTKKKRMKSSQDHAQDSQTEVIPSSLPLSDDEAHVHRFSFRIAEKRKREQQSNGGGGSYTHPRDIAIAVRALESSIHSNETKIEKIKEHRNDLQKRMYRLQYLVSNDESDIRFYERTNMQLKTQREELQQQIFESKNNL